MSAFPQFPILALLVTLVLGTTQAKLMAAAPIAPSNLKVTPIGANSFQLEWKDESLDETGWEIRTSLGNAVPTRFDRITQANVGGKVVIFGGYLPGVTINFQVAAYNGTSGSEQFGLSPIVKGKALSPARFLPPTTLKVLGFNDGEVLLTWLDKSTVELGYEVEMKAGNAASYSLLGTTNPGTTFNITIGDLTPSTLYSFRVRGLTTSQVSTTPYIYSSYTNEVSFTTKPFQAPTNLVAKALGDSTIGLTWNDESSIETGYDVEFREVGKTVTDGGSIAANSKSVNINDLVIGVPYEFRVRASKGALKSEFTPYVSLKIDDRFTSSLNPAIFFETPFNYPVLTTRPESVTSVTVTGLPAGLSYDSATKTISGSATVEGVRIAKITAFYGSSYSVQRDLVLRIVRPPKAPLIALSYTPQVLTVRRSVKLSVNGRFSDPDTLNAQRVTTTLGSFDMILYPLATPLTVTNFLAYVNGKRYADCFFHRSLPDFVLQGGGFKQSTKSGFTSVVKLASVLNEPGVSNLRGTIAMAKLPDLPNSATSEFFVNVNDNSENLNAQNGGFTVFGRVPTSGMAIVDAINALPRRTYSLSLAGVSQSFSDIPINSVTPSPVIVPTQLVKMISIAPAPILRYQVTSQNPSVATAVLSKTDIVIGGIAKGATTVTVTAIDLDGQTTSQVIPVTVN
jgi:cyclophilin family peptidyl-prolyl cis-trans isomerase